MGIWIELKKKDRCWRVEVEIEGEERLVTLTSTSSPLISIPVTKIEKQDNTTKIIWENLPRGGYLFFSPGIKLGLFLKNDGTVRILI
jgi:hypothetical protein